MKNIATIEDCLEIAAGIQQGAQINIDRSDVTIMNSIARQVFKGIALTDRQFDLSRQKLVNYKDQFSEYENFDIAIDTLRMPLREIDRSKYIKIVSHVEMVGPDKPYESYKQNWKWIKIRFPFSKKLIVSLDKINNKPNDYYHNKGSHEHFFRYNEQNVYNTIKEFKNKEFVIDDELLEIYQQLEEMNNNKKDYLPGIYNYKLCNLNKNAVNYIISCVGEPSKENMCLFKDRQQEFGLHHFDEECLEYSMSILTNLSKKIVNRKNCQILVKPNKYPFVQISESLLELNRFPLLVVLNENSALEELSMIHNSFSGFINNSNCSVMFRLDNYNNNDFNNYIKHHSLNNKIDSNTKVVYISTNKVPKPFIAVDWKPQTVLLMSSCYTNKKINIVAQQSDLVIHYDNNMSQIGRFQRQGIQEI